MKRFALFGFSALVLSALVAPAAQAQTTPADLVNLARNGYLQEQGIPAHNGLSHAVKFGQLQADDVVRAAIAQGRLSEDTLNNADYLNSIQFKLDSLSGD